MSREVKKHISLIMKYFTLNLSALSEYRTSFVTQVFGMALNNASFAFFWWVLYDRIGMDLNGYGFRQVMFLWAVASTGFGIANILFSNARQISRMIVTGELDTYLLQPKNPLVSSISSKMSATAWGDLAYGIILMMLIRADTGMWLVFSLSVFTAAVLMTAITVMGHALTFFFGNMEATGDILWEFTITFSIYPESIFKGPVKFFIMTVIPIGFITHIPLRIVNEFKPATLLLLLGITALYAFLAFMLFMKGLKRYESGNLMITRM